MYRDARREVDAVQRAALKLWKAECELIDKMRAAQKAGASLRELAYAIGGEWSYEKIRRRLTK